MSMNSHDIDDAASILAEYAPEIAPYAIYLRDWKDTVNRSSDGWSHWRAGSQCAKRLEGLVEAAVTALRQSRPHPVPADFAKTLAPIKSLATRKNLPVPVLGEAPAPAFR